MWSIRIHMRFKAKRQPSFWRLLGSSHLAYYTSNCSHTKVLFFVFMGAHFLRSSRLGEELLILCSSIKTHTTNMPSRSPLLFISSSLFSSDKKRVTLQIFTPNFTHLWIKMEAFHCIDHTGVFSEPVMHDHPQPFQKRRCLNNGLEVGIIKSL